MQWQTLFSNQRIGASKRSEQRDVQNDSTQNDYIRGDYMRDYDRLIFSSQFRRLQNKTQVFPLPGAVFVHNRLTHSLEVASVGRSLGRAVGERIAQKYQEELSPAALDFYRFELPAVVMTACIAHDIGNPPFGHSGEEAIRSFFRELEPAKCEIIERELSENQWNDFKNFEGNANAFRILTSIFLKNGLKLTYATLASIVKYPSNSTNGFNKKIGWIATKKSGFFDAEATFFRDVAETLQLNCLDTEKQVYARHPFVFLVEAADDICYRIIDLEDAHRLQIISTSEVLELLVPFFEGETRLYVEKKIAELEEDRQKLAFLRAMLINLLTNKCTDAFLENEALLLDGSLNKPLVDLLDSRTTQLMQKIDEISVKRIYKHSSVIEIEIAGYHVIGGLLNEFVSAVLFPSAAKSKMLLQLLPPQFKIEANLTLYEKLLRIIDFVSGMTDIYAVDLYRKITGIQMPQLRG